MEFPQICRH